MPYWELVTRSFRIAWDHKYLWLLALFSGEGGGGFNFSQRTGTPSTSTGGQPNFATLQQQLYDWLGSHIGLIVGLTLVSLVLLIGFFILGAVCEGATVRGSAEHDAGRPFRLGDAWRMGVHTMWIIVRLRLLVLLLNLPILLLIGGWVLALLRAIAAENGGAIASVALIGLFLLLIWIVYGSYLFFLDRYGNRAIVLEENRSAIAALKRAHGLLIKRLGRSVLVLLLSIGVGFVIGLAFACILAIVVVPFVAVGAAIAATSGSSAAVWPIIVLALVIFVPLSLLINGFFSAQTSTYWTLAFRRLDLDYTPAYSYPGAPQIPPTPQS